MNKFKIVEKKNHLAVYGFFSTQEKANNFLKETIPEYVRRSYFMDKTLKAEDFIVEENHE